MTAEHAATPSSKDVYDALSEAQKQYEEYVRLAQLAQSSVLPEPVNPSHRTWSHPLTLTIREQS
jgi:hypothetical protein